MDKSKTGFGEVIPGTPERGGSRAWRRWLLRWAPRSLGLFVLLLLAFLGVDYGAAIQSLVHARLEFLVPAFGIFLLSVLARLATWMLTASFFKLGYRRPIGYVRVFLVGWFAGLGVPQGATSLARLAVVAADKRSVGRGLVAVGVERVVQAAVLVFLLLLSSVYLSALSIEGLKWLLLGLGVLVAGALAITFVIRIGLMRPLIRRLGSIQRAQTFIEETKVAAREARHMPPRRLGSILGMALLMALLTVTSLFLASRALDLHISYVVLIAAWAAVGLTGLLPISINGLGPREGILTAAVAGVGLNSEAGVALGLLWFLMQAATRLIAGAVYFTALHGNQEAGNQEAGNQEAGNQEAGNQEAGNQEPMEGELSVESGD